MQPEHLKAAFAEAVWRKDEQLVETLIRMGADVNAKYDNDVTPLHLAVQDGDMSMARLLIRHGADIHMPNARGKTPLDQARFLDDVREMTIGKAEQSLQSILIEAYSMRHARRVKARHQLRGPALR